MSENNPITQEEHKNQINLFTDVRPHYENYAAILLRTLTRACTVAMPQAFIQSRAKTVSSFAEKCARKHDKYPDPVNQLTDLCGARVIVQTVEQVEAVRQFIKANFIICEEDEKGLSLGEDKFGYRDLHFIVQFSKGRIADIGITEEEAEGIGEFKAEIQVRTWLQHAWADTLHDRIYKNPLKLSPDIKRTGNLLAALMEEGDRNYNSMAHGLDAMIANYSAFAKREEVEKEIKILELILANEPAKEAKMGLALRLARLRAACGDFPGVVEALDPHSGVEDAHRCDLLLDLGYALCRVHRSVPASPEYRRGRSLLEESLTLCTCAQGRFVHHLCQRESLQARAHAKLAWALEAVSGEEPGAREHWRQAHECEPDNPYYLSEMLGLEMKFSHLQADLPSMMRTSLREAVKTCLAHAEAGTELPYAYFTAGRLWLLLEETGKSIGCYARGIRHVLAAEHCFPPDILETETEWLKKIHFGRQVPAEYQWVLDLIRMAVQIGNDPDTEPVVAPKVLILSGGAASLSAEGMDGVRSMLKIALKPFTGKVVSGGTLSGVPACVGEVADALRKEGQKHFELIGYLCNRLPHDAPKDERYDTLFYSGEGEFSAAQLLHGWNDLLQGGIKAREVLLIGFGGGPISAMEYAIGLAFGATVAVMPDKAGDSADRLIKDPLWSGQPNLFPLPADPATLRALVVRPVHPFPVETLENMAASFHENYVAGSSGKLPPQMKKWPELEATFKRANYEQAKYAIEILKAGGFGVREAQYPVIFTGFEDADIERMAELEHGRWNIERLRDGWRLGPRDDAKKRHNCLVEWKTLQDGDAGVKKYDRNSVKKFPETLAKAGLEVYRL